MQIQTERLLLRSLTVADAEEVFEWVSDDRVSRYMVYNTYTDVEQVRDWLSYVENSTETYHFGFQRLSDGKLIGSGDIGFDQKKVFGDLVTISAMTVGEWAMPQKLQNAFHGVRR